MQNELGRTVSVFEKNVARYGYNLLSSMKLPVVTSLSLERAIRDFIVPTQVRLNFL